MVIHQRAKVKDSHMHHVHPTTVSMRVNQLIRRLRSMAVDKHKTVPVQIRYSQCKNPVPWKECKSLEYREISIGEEWGKTWESAWFHVTGSVPREWKGEYIVACIDLGGEVLVVSKDGDPICGMTQGSVFDEDYAKDILHLIPSSSGDERVELWLEATASGLFGVTRTDPEMPHEFVNLHGFHRGVVRSLCLSRLDVPAYSLLNDMEVLDNLFQGLPDGSPRKARLLIGLDAAVGEFHKSGIEGCKRIIATLLDVPSDPSFIKFYAVGHAHIDVAWLWRVAESRRKAARTFASQCGLLERYPDYVFGASQAQLYQFVKEDYPNLYERIKKAISGGRWEVQGAMWVEADCNLPNGESLIRQILVGKRFFKDEFDLNIENLWLPDVFGYSGQLPQIMKKSGIKYFLTQKLNWNKINKFPHNTFIWRGIDGSDVLAHFPPENNYNARCKPAALLKAQERFVERGITDCALSLYGIGDGGGGPKEEFIERAIRMRDLNGCPQYQMGRADVLFNRLEKWRSCFGRWQGELYFELHRGTYTTQGAMKKANRRAEEAIVACEQMCSLDIKEYPKEELDKAWKILLTNQFHDIIPGSSIHGVYEEAVSQDEGVARDCHDLMRRSALSLMRRDDQRCTYYNPSGTAYDDVVALPAGWGGASVKGRRLLTQEDGGCNYVRLVVPPQAFVSVQKESRCNEDRSYQTDRCLILENEIIRYDFSEDGHLVSAVYQGGGENFISGAANDLAIYEDRPHNFDAWDIDDQLRLARLGGAVVKEWSRCVGPLWSEIKLSAVIGNSSLTQRIRLRSGSARLDFRTEVEWNERHKMIRVLFPTTINVDRFVGEVQYGHVSRPARQNTTWDLAQFEVCCHRWADLSDNQRGCAILNNCKYGYDCKDGVIGLSLLRSPTEPDPVADIGFHDFIYSFYPHSGCLYGSGVRAEAAMINSGVVILEGVDGEGVSLPVCIEGEGLEISVIKKSEDDNSLIVRVIEVRGHSAVGRLCAPGYRIIPTDLMEWSDDLAMASREFLDINVGPFSIETFRVARIDEGLAL